MTEALLSRSRLFTPVHVITEVELPDGVEREVLTSLQEASDCPSLTFSEISAATNTGVLAQYHIAATAILHCDDRIGWIKNYNDADEASREIEIIVNRPRPGVDKKRELIKPHRKTLNENRLRANGYREVLHVAGNYALRFSQDYTDQHGQLDEDKVEELYSATGSSHPVLASLAVARQNPVLLRSGAGVQAERTVRFMLQEASQVEAAD